jgi:hypothetical protein
MHGGNQVERMSDPEILRPGLVYRIAYQPADHFVSPVTTTKIPYFAVVSDTTRRPIGFAFDENDAQTICLAMDLLTATVKGDRSRLRELSKLIDALNKGFN